MKLFAGAVSERPPGPKYVTALNYVELAPLAPLPKTATLQRWRENLTSGFQVALRAPKACWQTSEGPLRASDELDRGLQWLRAAVVALEATLVVIPTEGSITTGARDRTRLRDYFDRLALPDTTAVVWQPGGLWEPVVRERMAASLEVVPAFDPLDDPAPEGDVLYASLRAEGFRRAFSHAQLDDVVGKLAESGASRAYVSIDSPQSFREATLLQSLAEGDV